jgi:hypothetical protein
LKKNFLILILLLCKIYCFADGENICVVTNTGSSGQACTPNTLGMVNPCTNLLFKVNYQVPLGFIVVAQYEWFVNGVSVKTTTSPSDQFLEWQIKTEITTVFCKVTYKKSNGDLSQVYQSNSFTPNVKQLNFAINGIIAASPQPNLGCTTNIMSYSLNPFTCIDFCSTTFTVGQYNISWQPPTGWNQTSISINGNDVSFQPDASSGGSLTATISLPCGYTDLRTFTISRNVQKPTFSFSNNTFCSSSASLSINPICGALDYTYTIIGPSGITFTSNGLQSLTTSSTTPLLNLTGNSTSFIFKAKANYVGSISSAEESIELVYGTPKLIYTSGFEAFNLTGQWFDYGANGPGNSFSVCTNENLSFMPYVPNGAIPGTITGHEWTITGNYNFVGPLNQSYLNVVSQSTHPNSFQFTYRYQNACGWSPIHNGQASTINCAGGEEPFRIGENSFDFILSPNPAINEVVVNTKGIIGPLEIRVFDLITTKLVKQQRYEKGQTQVKLQIANLKAGTYVLQITCEGQTKAKQLIIIK